MVCGAQMHMQISSVTGLARSPRAVLYGSRATLCFSDDRIFMGFRDDAEFQEVTIPAEMEGGWRVEEEFVRAILRQESITHTTFMDGVKYMTFTEAVHASIVTGRSVPLSDIR